MNIPNLKINDFTIMPNLSKSSDYIPYLITSFFHSIYDQFQMITENFFFLSRQMLIIHFSYMKII